MPRIPLVVANWKMNGTVEETLKRITELRHKLTTELTEVVIAPPFTALYSAHVVLQETPIKLAAQNMHWESDGAYTGEISPVFLREVGCQYAIIGHSERREHFGETDETVNLKIRAALAQELTPILCVGETAEQRVGGRTEAVLEAQLKRDLLGLPMADLKCLVIAYEPVWAIGSGKNATAGEIEGALRFIRNYLGKTYDGPTANEIRLLYGGSVSPENLREIYGAKEVDGLLVGGASLVTEKLLKMIRYTEGKDR